MQSAFRSINIPKLPVLTSEEGIKSIKNNLDMLWIGQCLENLSRQK